MQSLFGVGKRRSGFMGVEGRSLFGFEGIGDRVLWCVRGDRYLMWRFRRSLNNYLPLHRRKPSYASPITSRN